MLKHLVYKFADWRARVWFAEMTEAWDSEDYYYYRIARENTNHWSRRALRYAQI